MFNIILSVFYIIFPIVYQFFTAVTYWVTFCGTSSPGQRISSSRFLFWLNLISCTFYIALFLVVSIIKSNIVSTGLFPTVLDPENGALWTHMMRGTFWLVLINIITHSVMIKSKLAQIPFKHVLWLTFLCNTVSYTVTLFLLFRFS